MTCCPSRALCAVVWCVGTAAAHADPVVVYGSLNARSAWLASVSASTVYAEDFQNVPDTWHVANTTLSRGGITYNRIAGTLIVTGDQEYANFGGGVQYDGLPAGHVPLGEGVLTEGGEEHFEVVFDTAVRVVAMDVFLNGRENTNVNPAVVPFVKFFNGSTLLATAMWPAGQNNRSFLGYAGDVGVTRFEFSTYAGSQVNTGIDNLVGASVVTNTSAVPEPDTLGLLALGLAAAAVAGRGRRH